MYVERYAYYCDYGADADRCLGGERGPAGKGWELAFTRFGNKRVASVAARSAILATSAVLRCTQDAGAQAAVSAEAVANLPIFVASGTGLGFSAHFARALVDAESGDRSLEQVLFSSDGPHVIEGLRYSATMLAGLIAQFTGVRGENRSVTGCSAGLLALRQAERYLQAGRSTHALVVCGESLIEWMPERAIALGGPGPREIGCAFLVTSTPRTGAARLQLDPVSSLEPSPPPFAHFEAANAVANLCWALEQESGQVHLFAETDFNGKRWNYGLERQGEV